MDFLLRDGSSAWESTWLKTMVSRVQIPLVPFFRNLYIAVFLCMFEKRFIDVFPP